MDIFKQTRAERLHLEMVEVYAKLDELKAQLPKTQRADAGKKRAKYDSTLPLRYKQYLGRANKKSIPFQLTVQEFELVCSGRCCYCGSGNKIGVDRIDSSLGYTTDNVQSCCGTCNWMKQSTRHEDFLRHIEKVYKYSFSI